MRRTWGCAVALALMLAACGGGDDTPTGSASSPPASAERDVKAAIKGLVEAGSAHYTSHVELPGLKVDESGQYRITPTAYRAETTLATGSKKLTVVKLGVRKRLFVSFPDKDLSPTECYMTGDLKKIIALTGADVGTTTTALPPVTFVAASARGTGYDGDTLFGTVDLADALALINSNYPGRLGVQPGDQRVVATLRITDGTLTGFTVDGDALSDAADEAGFGGEQAAFPPDSVIEGTLTDVGSTVDVSAPASGKLVPLDEGQRAFRRAAARCQSR